MEKGNEKCLLDDQKSCSSFKNLEQKSRHQTAENKSADEIPSSDESSDDQNQSQSQVENNIDGSLNDLPPEVLMAILGNLDAPSLFACRLVNRQFNSISTEILRSRREVEIKFRAYKEKKLMLAKRGKKLNTKGGLQDFVEIMKQSKNCPFVRFSFDFSNSSLSKLDYFLAEFNVSRIKCFKFSYKFRRDEVDSRSAIFDVTEKVRDLLLNKLPHLEEFGLDLPYALGEQRLELFSRSIQLPHLKVLHFGRLMFSIYPVIVQDLLTAAVNLGRILPFDRDSLDFKVSDFGFVHSLGKLELVQHVQIWLSPECISEIQQTVPNLPNLLKLNTLKLNVLSDLKNFDFLSALFESSKNTLESLEIWQLGFLHNLQIPRFIKLDKLSLRQRFKDDDAEEDFRLFPPGVKFLELDIFPVVRDLELNIENWRAAFPEENSIPRLPNVQRILLKDRGEVTCQTELLASICPKVRHLKITPHDRTRLNFFQVVRTVATHLPKLESLELFIDLHSQYNNSHTFDSLFTGFSQENCKRLFDSAEALKKLNFAEKIINSVTKTVFKSKLESDVDSKLIPEREYPSIFHMKNLKKLTVDLEPVNWRHTPRRKDFIDKLTWISKKYALDLMPQLEITPDEE